MAVEFEHRDKFGKPRGNRERLFSQSDVVLDGHSGQIGTLSVTPARGVHVESDNAVSFMDWKKGKIPYLNTGLSGELRRQEINDAHLRTRRDRFGGYSVLVWRPTTEADRKEEIARFGNFLPNTQSDLVHEITVQVAHEIAIGALHSMADRMACNNR